MNRKTKFAKEILDEYGLLVTPEEAFRINYESATLGDMYAAELFSSYGKQKLDKETDWNWRNLKIMSFIFTAGRIQGIREERRRKRKNTAGKEVKA